MPLISLLLTLKKLYSNSNALIIDFEHAHFSYVILLKVNKKAINLCSKHVQSQLYTQLTFTYSKSTIETLGKVVVVLVFLLLSLNIFHTFSWCFYCSTGQTPNKVMVMVLVSLFLSLEKQYDFLQCLYY